jgi:glycosyltransferase involved in cell wall biosynthesis
MSLLEAAAPPADTGAAPGRRLRVCFVAHNAFGALTGRASGHSGGVERQSSLWARWFAGRGHDVRLVTWDAGQEAGTRVAGVSVLKLCRKDEGMPGLRFFHPRWTSLVRALDRADADVYHYMSHDAVLGQLALWCRRNHRALTYYVSSRTADRVMVQTRWQQSMLREHFRVDSTPLPMPCEEPVPAPSEPSEMRHEAGTRVLWVGRYSKEKRLEWLFDLARTCPDLHFDVAGAANESDAYAEALTRQGRSLPNVTLHGRVSDPATLAGLYRKATVLCCTSAHEGFPNTFLEAWSHGVPVVTTFDPDGIVARLELGAAADDVSGLARGVRGLLESRDRLVRTSQNARRYYVENHRPASVLPTIERVFLDAACGDGGHAGQRRPSARTCQRESSPTAATGTR